MHRSIPYTRLAAIALGLTLAACGDSSSTDECEGKPLCSSAGVSCDGDVLVTCAMDADGCLVETTDDCAAGGQVCDDTGGAPACIDDGCDDPECTGASDGDSFCSGDTAVSCADDGAGCLVATTTDCTTTTQECYDGTGTATCVDPCTDDPACAGASEGDLSCGGPYSLDECTDTNADGCLDLVRTDCTPGLCDDSGTPMCATVTETGNGCADAIPVLSSGFLLTGADFTADFTDDLSLADSSCVTRSGGQADAVFSVDLLAGDTVYLAELGGFDSTRNIQTTCGDAEVCVASVDQPESEVLSYTASADETVYLVVETYFASPSTTDYAIAISINPACGNGLLEAGELCDDGNTAADDGCDASCAIEFGYECDTGSPTVCTSYPFLGTFAGDDTISDVIASDPVTGGTSDFYLIEFSEAILLSGTLSATSTGDPDFFLIDDTRTDVIAAATTDDESWADEPVPAGLYLIEVYAYGSTDVDGYTLTLDPAPAPVCGNGLLEGTEECDDNNVATGDGCDDVCNAEFGYGCDGASPTVCTMYPSLGSFGVGDPIDDVIVTDSIPAGQNDHYLITFTEDLILSGALIAGTSGDDPDYRLYDSAGPVASHLASGDESWPGDTVAAGTYVIQIRAYSALTTGYTLSLATGPLPVCGDGTLEAGEECDDNNVATGDGCDDVCAVEFGYECDGGSPSTCTSYPSLGSFAAADPIADVVVTDAMAADDMDFYLITFTEDVLLSGALVAGVSGEDPDFRLSDAGGTVVSHAAVGDEAWTNDSVSAGTYVIRVRAFTALGAGYTLSMSTTAP